MTTTEHELTPVEIMQLAGVEPGIRHYLKEIRQQAARSPTRTSRTSRSKIHKNKQRFITNSLEPTPVS